MKRLSGYTVVMDWMLSLELNTTELLVFACIHGFSQSGSGFYFGGNEYLARRCKCSTKTISRILAQLVNENYLIKRVQKIGTRQIVFYQVNEDYIEKILADKPLCPEEDLMLDPATIEAIRRTINSKKENNSSADINRDRSQCPNEMDKMSDGLDKMSNEGTNCPGQGTKCPQELDKMSPKNKEYNKNINKNIKNPSGKKLEKTEAPSLSDQRPDVREIVEHYNSELDRLNSDMPKICSISDSRRRHICARVKEYGMDKVKACITKALSNSFLGGKNSRNWRATFTWLMLPTNFEKVIEGAYDKLTQTNNNSNRPNNATNYLSAAERRFRRIDIDNNKPEDYDQTWF